jgi:hypothetical protein
MSLTVKPLKERITNALGSNNYTDWKVMAWQAILQERIPRQKCHASLQE